MGVLQEEGRLADEPRVVHLALDHHGLVRRVEAGVVEPAGLGPRGGVHALEIAELLDGEAARGVRLVAQRCGVVLHVRDEPVAGTAEANDGGAQLVLKEAVREKGGMGRGRGWGGAGGKERIEIRGAFMKRSFIASAPG